MPFMVYSSLMSIDHASNSVKLILEPAQVPPPYFPFFYPQGLPGGFFEPPRFLTRSQLIAQDTAFFRGNSKVDNWGKWYEMDQDLIDKITEFRRELGYPVYVTSGYRDGDGTSQHHLGKAVDVMSPEFVKNRGLFDMYLIAEKYGFGGIGIYPHWKWRAQKWGGLHLDVRNEDPGARWMGVRVDEHNPANQDQKYIALDMYNLKKYKVIL